MADNVPFQTTVATPASGTSVASKEVTFSGDTTKVQLVELVGVTGAEGSRTLNEISNASGLIVQDGGNSLTVDGSITANAGTNLNTSALALESGGNLAAAVTALQILDNFISGARGLVTEDNSASILTAVQTIDNFISGSRGLVTEDNSAAILTALQTIDNFISGSRGLVTEDNSAAALAALQIIDNLVTTEDTASANGDSGLVVFARRTASPANTSGTDGDYEALQVSAGRLWTSATVDAALPAGDNNIGNVDLVTVPAPLSTTGGGTEATALRVTVASDSTGVLSVDDNGGSLTVDGTVTANLAAGTNNIGDVDVLSIAAGDNNIGNVDIVTMPAVTNAGTFAVQESGSALTALQLIDNLVLAEDAAHVSGDVGVQVLAVRKDSGAAIAGTDGDYSPLQVDSSGNLRVNIAAGAAAGGTSATDEATYTPTSSAGTPIMGAADETSPDAAAEGTLAIIRSTLNRALHVNLRDASGAEVSVGGGTQYTEDAAATANPVGNAMILVREDARAGGLVSADGDNVAARGTNAGELYVKHVDAIPVTDNSGSLTIDNAALAVTGGGVEASALRVTIANDSTGVLSVDDNGASLTVDGTVAVSSVTTSVTPGTAAANLGKAEDAAHASGDVGVMALSVRQDTAAALGGTDADYQPLITDASGRLHVNVGNTVTVGSHAVTNAGTFATQESGAALTALQLIDDAVKTDDAAFTPATDKVLMIGAQLDATSPDSVDEGDAGALRMTADRALHISIRDTAGNNRGANVNASNQLSVSVDNTVTVGSHAVTNAGTFAVQVDGSALTALQLIDNPVLVDDAAFTPATSSVMMAGFQADETSTDSIDEGDAGAARMSLDRKQYVIAHNETSTIYQNGTARTPAFAIIDAATSGDNTLLAAQGASNKIRVHQLFLVSAGTVTVRFESGAGGTALTGQMNLVANTGFALPYSPIGWFETAANTLLNLELSAAVSVDGNFAYTVVT